MSCPVVLFDEVAIGPARGLRLGLGLGLGLGSRSARMLM